MSKDHVEMLINDIIKSGVKIKYNTNKEWEKAGYSGIKFLNGINHTRRTWQGAMISHTDTTNEIVRKIEEHIDLLCG